jgi:hypothetical protein
MKVNDDDPLCSTCSTLDFYSIIRNGIREDDAVPLGYLTDIIKKRDQCGLCRLIATYFSQCGINLRMITCKLYAPGERSLVGTVIGGHNGLLIQSSRDGFTLQMRLLGGTGSKVCGPKWSHGQRVGQNVDANQLKRWIHTCKKKHRETCESDWWRHGEVLPNTVRVVDVVRMAIVPVPPSCHFVALSYVWGMPGEGYWTTQANIKQRSAPGGLDASILPATISDAILLVRQLGERYLWIDSLCIVQDDPSDKAVQIGVMELIYGSSEFTIFATAGTSRDPIPGVRPSTRDPKQHIAKIQGLQLALPLPNAKEIITNSTWNERGWTYQEVMLSRRRIFFTAKQVYFECRKEIHSEEMLPQPGLPISRPGMSGLGQIIPKTRSAHVHLTCESYLRPYMKIVEEFTQRKLTFQSDIVDAVDALLRGLTKAFELADGDYDKAFRFGMLLTGCLDDALLWQPRANAPHSRRVPTNVMWPSWSWAAWQGAVRYVSDAIYHNNDEGLNPSRFKFGQSLVKWYIVNENGQLVHQYVDHRKRKILEHNPRLATNTTYVAPKGDIDSQQLMTDVPLVPGTLVFRTSFSRFDVTPWESDTAGAGVNYAIYSILSDIPRPSTRVGRIILPTSTYSPASHEFIVLSRSTELPVGIYDAQRLGESYCGCMLYVMAVQKMQDGKRFERVGVGIVFEQAWVESAPEEKIIYLR